MLEFLTGSLAVGFDDLKNKTTIPVRMRIHFSHCFTVFLQFILFNLLLSKVVCSDEVLWPTSDFFLTFSDE